MTRVLFLGCLFLGAAAVGCGGGGVDSNKKLSELTDSEAQDLCADVTSESKDCGGLMVSRDASMCESGAKAVPDSCTATVADVEACNAADICDMLTNAACMKVIACVSAM